MRRRENDRKRKEKTKFRYFIVIIDVKRVRYFVFLVFLFFVTFLNVSNTRNCGGSEQRKILPPLTRKNFFRFSRSTTMHIIIITVILLVTAVFPSVDRRDGEDRINDIVYVTTVLTRLYRITALAAGYFHINLQFNEPKFFAPVVVSFRFFFTFLRPFLFDDNSSADSCNASFTVRLLLYDAVHTRAFNSHKYNTEMFT